MSDRTPLDNAVAAFIWTLFVRCQHDNEGHNLPAIHQYLVRRFSRPQAWR